MRIITKSVLLCSGVTLVACGSGSSVPELAGAKPLDDLQGAWEYVVDPVNAPDCVNTIEFQEDGTWYEYSQYSIRHGNYVVGAADSTPESEPSHTVTPVTDGPVTVTAVTDPTAGTETGTDPLLDEPLAISRHALLLSVTFDNGMLDCAGVSDSDEGANDVLYFDSPGDGTVSLYEDSSDTSEPLAVLKAQEETALVTVDSSIVVGTQVPTLGAAVAGEADEIVDVHAVLQLELERAEQAQIRAEQRVLALQAAAEQRREIALLIQQKSEQAAAALEAGLSQAVPLAEPEPEPQPETVLPAVDTTGQPPASAGTKGATESPVAAETPTEPVVAAAKPDEVAVPVEQPAPPEPTGSVAETAVDNTPASSNENDAKLQALLEEKLYLEQLAAAEALNAQRAQQELEAAKLLAQQKAQETQEVINNIATLENTAINVSDTSYRLMMCKNCTIAAFSVDWSIDSTGTADRYQALYGIDAASVGTLLVENPLTSKIRKQGTVSVGFDYGSLMSNANTETSCYGLKTFQGTVETGAHGNVCLTKLPFK